MPAPSAPTGLTVLSQNGSVFLNWTVPTSNGGAVITDYRVQRRLASQTDASFVVVPDTVKATPGATIVSANGVSYIFRVAAINRFGVGAYSANSAAVTPYGIPNKPNAPTCISGAGQVTINWVAPANNGSAVTDYAVQRKLNGQGDAAYVSLVDGVSTSTTFTNTGLVNGAGYIYRIAAINARGASVWSADSAFVVPSAAPNAPVNLVASAPYNAANNTGGLVALSWTAPANNGSLISDYIIQRKLDGQPDSSFAQVADAVSPAVTASIASANGTSYVFRVAAVNAKGVGAYSANSAVVTPSIKPSVCPPPICTRGFGQVTLNWSPATSNGAAITNHIVQRKINGQADTAYVSINTGSGGTSYTATGLVNGTAYVFRVAAVNIRGAGPFSPASQLVIPGALPPGAPTSLVATIVNETGVSLSWTPPANNGGASITGNIVQAKSVDRGSPYAPYTWRTVANNYAPGVSLDLDGFDDLPTNFRVAAVNAAGTGTFSDISNTVTPSNKLFDKSSWRDIVAEPYFSHLNKAADRWYKYIKYNSDVRSAIVSANKTGWTDIPGGVWNGLRLRANLTVDGTLYPGYELYSNSASTTVASTSVYRTLPLSNPPDKRRNSITFSLKINDYYRSILPENSILNAITHELGHALGIGVFWQAAYAGSTVPVNHFLDGSVYSSCRDAYNSITGLSRTKTPVENSGGAGTIGSHWEDNFRTETTTSYPGVDNELMRGSVLESMVLSRLSIRTLVDFGYEEISPGSIGEGNPRLINSGQTPTPIRNNDVFVSCGGYTTPPEGIVNMPFEELFSEQVVVE
jgi:hypothetical protein